MTTFTWTGKELHNEIRKKHPQYMWLFDDDHLKKDKKKPVYAFDTSPHEGYVIIGKDGKYFAFDTATRGEIPGSRSTGYAVTNSTAQGYISGKNQGGVSTQRRYQAARDSRTKSYR